MCTMNIRDRVKELRRVPASSLRPSPFNWRTHPKAQLDALRGVLAEVGYAGAALARELADGSLELIDGHARAETCGDALVPVLVLDVTEAEAKKILATFDPLGAMAEADAGKLDALLKDVETSNAAVAEMLDALAHEHGVAEAVEPGGGGDEFDAAPAEGPTRAKAGELWVIGGKHRLIVGDCTDPANVARLMGGERGALCFTSPPYNLGASVGLRNGTFRGKDTAYTGSSADDSAQEWSTLMEGFARVALFHCDYLAANVQMLAGNKAALAAWLGNWSEHLADVYVWVKSNPPPAMAERVASSAFEFVFLFAAEKNPTRAVATASFGRGEFSNVHTSAVGCNSHTDGLHGATFPVEVAAHYLRNLTGHGTTVLDPFLGSGTTLIAAHRLGRTCYGCELEPKYADMILRRAEAEGLTCERAE